MKALKAYMLLSLLTCAMGTINGMDHETDTPIITLNSVKNGITLPDRSGSIECLLNGKELGTIVSGRQSTISRVLFTHHDGKGDKPSIKRLNLEFRHPKREGFKEFRLKLSFDGSDLAIVKDLSGKQMPQEFHPLEDGKKYMLNLEVEDGDQVSAELVEYIE